MFNGDNNAMRLNVLKKLNNITALENDYSIQSLTTPIYPSPPPIAPPLSLSRGYPYLGKA